MLAHNNSIDPLTSLCYPTIGSHNCRHSTHKNKQTHHTAWTLRRHP
ncbi:MAG: hypothetical protein R3Y16_08070 [Rikenellaceae bacterium]